MSARVYFMKTVNGCKELPTMSPLDEQYRRTSLLCLYTVIFLFYWVHTRMQLKHKKQIVNIADENLTDYSFLIIIILNQRIIWKYYIEFVTEFPCLLGHPVAPISLLCTCSHQLLQFSFYMQILIHLFNFFKVPRYFLIISLYFVTCSVKWRENKSKKFTEFCYKLNFVIH